VGAAVDVTVTEVAEVDDARRTRATTRMRLRLR
jgi:hypothetical protein